MCDWRKRITVGEHIVSIAVRLGRGKGNCPLPLYAYTGEALVKIEN